MLSKKSSNSLHDCTHSDIHNRNTSDFEFFATCAKGLEHIVAEELDSFGISGLRPLSSGVAFRADIKKALRAMIWLRSASRLNFVVGRVECQDADALYEGCREISWEEHLCPSKTIAVFSKGGNSNLRDSRFISRKIKDAICDRLREKTAERPDVDPSNPDLPIRVTVHDKKAALYIDLCGKPLHVRGYRLSGEQVVSPLKENLAAAILLSASWSEIAQDNGAFCDPFCGSGTLAIEAAMIARDIAPSIFRDSFSAQNWLLFDEDAFSELLDEADDRAHQGSQNTFDIFASDVDSSALEIAFANAKRATVANTITFVKTDIANLNFPFLDRPLGLIATNPPYGQRLLDQSQIPAIISMLTKLLSSCPKGWVFADISDSSVYDLIFGGNRTKQIETFNGPLKAYISVYSGPFGIKKTSGVASASNLSESTLRDSDAARPGDFDVVSAQKQDEQNNNLQTCDSLKSQIDLDQFSNRLRKMAKHRAKWAKRSGISCYRIYDADLADFALSVDLYEGAQEDTNIKWAYVCEYKAPAKVDQNLAQVRAISALGVIQQVLDIPSTNIFFKQRVRSKGGSQYALAKSGDTKEVQNLSKKPSKHKRNVVAEGGHFFEVDFSSRLDTGIFLDGRLIRQLIEEKSRGKSFLNLFAYTGSATVYAASGGARTTCTVDISQNYLDWAKANMSRNGYKGKNHTFERADVLQWVSQARHSKRKFDLIYIDPPTFSNSKKMKESSWNVQRDHAELLIEVSRILTEGGQAFFCCNLKGFKPDLETLEAANVSIKDITNQTIPQDFERNSKIHHCYVIHHISRD